MTRAGKRSVGPLGGAGQAARAWVANGFTGERTLWRPCTPGATAVGLPSVPAGERNARCHNLVSIRLKWSEMGLNPSSARANTRSMKDADRSCSVAATLTASAAVEKLANSRASGARALTGLGVRVPPAAPLGWLWDAQPTESCPKCFQFAMRRSAAQVSETSARASSSASGGDPPRREP